MKKAFRYVCILIGIALLGAGVHLYNTFTNMPMTVVVADNNLHKENDDSASYSGNMVMLRGKIAARSNVKDNALGVTTKYPVLQRCVEMKQVFLDGDKVMIGWKDQAVKPFKDKNGKEWKNPPFPSDYKNSTFYGDFYLNDGDLPVSLDFLKQFLDMEKYKEQFYILKNLPEDKTPKDFEYKKNHYIKEIKKQQGLGSIRIYYKVLYTGAEGMPEFTIAGQQRNGKLMRNGDDARFYDKPMELEEIRQTYTEDRLPAALSAVCFGAFFILLGVFKARD